MKLPLAAITALEQEIIKQHGEDLIVPDRLTNPDKLIISAKKSLEEKISYGFKGGLIGASWNELYIGVTPQNVSRALRFMDTFIKIIRKRGHEIILKNQLTHIIIQEEEEIVIKFREKLKRVLVQNTDRWKTYDYTATGILTFNARIYFRDVEWKDDKVPLEKQLAKIIAKFEIAGEELKKERIKRERDWAEQREKQRIEQEKQKRKEKELANFKNLLQHAKRWQEAELIRNYINAVEARAIQENNLSEEIKNWLLWVRKKADWYDPLMVIKDELLDDIVAPVQQTFTLP